MTQNTWTCRNFNKLSRGSKDDGFVQTKYECDQYDESNIMTPTSGHDNAKRERQQISNTRLNHTMMTHNVTWWTYWRDINKVIKMVK